MQAAIEISNLSKNFRKIPALSYIDLELEKGRSLALLGPNGAGKTTLLKIISTLILSDEGKVMVGGYSVGEDDEKIKNLIGLVTAEERSFYWRLSGRQNLAFFASLYDLDRKQARSRINELLEFFKIDYADRRFDSYSTGMKRKFALIRALLHNPEILLLDEPTKSLDYNSTQEVRELIKKLIRIGKTIIFATHNMEEAQDLCDLFVILHKGRIYGSGTPSAGLPEIYLKITNSGSPLPLGEGGDLNASG